MEYIVLWIKAVKLHGGHRSDNVKKSHLLWLGKDKQYYKNEFVINYSGYLKRVENVMAETL